MTQSPEIAASASQSEAIARCEAELAEFTKERDESVKLCRELLAAEDPAAGVFHAAEIFRLQQNKLRLEVEMEFRRKKINRIRLGYDDADAQSAGGLVL